MLILQGVLKLADIMEAVVLPEEKLLWIHMTDIQNMAVALFREKSHQG